MCGIMGVAGSAGCVSAELLYAQRDALHHRGPDAGGIWRSPDGCIGLAHRRLSIVDLSPTGQQPMASVDGQLQLVFNGEIYNHRELRRELERIGYESRGSSDTEVLLHAYEAWGIDALDRLNGMFAFALFDGRKRQLLLARDRVGEKPLFYRHDGGRFSFASELKALLADPSCPRVLDADALNYYLAYGYVPGEHCLLQGFRKLPPAHALRYDLVHDRVETWRYWTLPTPGHGRSASDAELLDELESLLYGAVERQLVADVPVGVLLSGGVDSSLITALAARASSAPVRTFTIAFPGHGKFDEGPYARLVASHFGTRHEELEAEPATVELLPELARQYDEPIADSSMVPTYLVSRLVRQHATVALGGDGGDELFGGYLLYTWAARQNLMRRMTPGAVANLVSAVGERLPMGYRGRSLMLSFALSPMERVARSGLIFNSIDREALAPLLREETLLSPERYRAGCGAGARTLLQRLTTADLLTYLPEDILVKVDRASMLTSLEVRAPFLDRHVVEFAFGRLPDRLRGTLRKRKVILRRLAARLLPPKMDVKRKQGFGIPLDAWYRGPWGEFMEGVLREADPGLFDSAFISDVLDRQRGRMANSQRIFLLVMLELWRREYGVSLP